MSLMARHVRVAPNQDGDTDLCQSAQAPFKAFDTFSMAVVADSGNRSTVGVDANRGQSSFTSKTGMIRFVDAS